jgi:hypothetical protein
MKIETRIKLETQLERLVPRFPSYIVESDDFLIKEIISIANLYKNRLIKCREVNSRLTNEATELKRKLTDCERKIRDLEPVTYVTEYVTKKEFEEYKDSLNKEPEGKIHKMSELPKEDADYDSFSVNVEALTQGGNWVEGYFYLRRYGSAYRGDFWLDNKSWTKPNLYQGWRYLKD